MNDTSIFKYKVGIITDWLVSPGGADRFLLSLLKVFPKADVYTAVYNKEAYQGEFNIPVNVKTTFIQKLPFKKTLSRHYNLLTPVAFENLDLRQYDLVISISAGPAKGVITGLHQKHIAMILTPPRYLWDNEQNFRSSRFRKLYSFVSPFMSGYLRIWDLSAVKRADSLISISSFIQRKVKKIYSEESEVIYPGLADDWFDPVQNIDSKNLQIFPKYFLIVSRLYDYKRIDWAIRAAVETGVNLVIVGEGPDRKYLEKLADDRRNIRFLGWIPKDTLKFVYSHAEALLFCGIEDFGYVPVEAMSQGTPVIAFNQGGVCETVAEGKSGEFFDSYESLVSSMTLFRKDRYDKEAIVDRARLFSESKFRKRFIKFIQNELAK
ncbi:glycosyltransferase [Candidatus Nomurabacteria bacterium]|nr:glycosyltransferase [Candidatus Nomurabacteria bacterium]